MTDELDSILRDGARAALPADAQLERGLARLQADIALGAGPSMAIDPTSPLASTAGGGVGLKLLLGAVLIAAVAAIGYAVVNRDSGGGDASSVAAGTDVDARTDERMTGALAEEPTAKSIGAETAFVQRDVAPVDALAPVDSVEPAKSAPRMRNRTASDPAVDPDTLAEEERLLARARKQLATGDSAGALEVIATHRKKFAKGVLTEEALALRALAICAGEDRNKAGAEAKRFLASYPDSLHAARVSAACK